jgi:hypothetical protein
VFVAHSLCKKTYRRFNRKNKKNFSVCIFDDLYDEIKFSSEKSLYLALLVWKTMEMKKHQKPRIQRRKKKNERK